MCSTTYTKPFEIQLHVFLCTFCTKEPISLSYCAWEPTCSHATSYKQKHMLHWVSCFDSITACAVAGAWICAKKHVHRATAESVGCGNIHFPKTIAWQYMCYSSLSPIRTDDASSIKQWAQKADISMLTFGLYVSISDSDGAMAWCQAQSGSWQCVKPGSCLQQLQQRWML